MKPALHQFTAETLIQMHKRTIVQLHRSARLTYGCPVVVLLLDSADAFAMQLAKMVEATRNCPERHLILTAAPCFEVGDLLVKQCPAAKAVVYGLGSDDAEARVVVVRPDGMAAKRIPVKASVVERLFAWLGIGSKLQPINAPQ